MIWSITCANCIGSINQRRRFIMTELTLLYVFIHSHSYIQFQCLYPLSYILDETESSSATNDIRSISKLSNIERWARILKIARATRILRMLRLFKMSKNFERINTIAINLINVLPTLMPFFLFLMVLTYMYAIVGIEIYAKCFTFAEGKLLKQNLASTTWFSNATPHFVDEPRKDLAKGNASRQNGEALTTSYTKLHANVNTFVHWHTHLCAKYHFVFAPMINSFCAHPTDMQTKSQTGTMRWQIFLPFRWRCWVSSKSLRPQTGMRC